MSEWPIKALCFLAKERASTSCTLPSFLWADVRLSGRHSSSLVAKNPGVWSFGPELRLVSVVVVVVVVVAVVVLLVYGIGEEKEGVIWGKDPERGRGLYHLCEDWESSAHEARFFDVVFEQSRVPAVPSTAI